ncbi:hypothetical protein WNJ68_19720 [Klebsiella grimontii]|uniref:hypothetical protein n=1 Tax=Klebsiella TaxID=570 RepID=UPI0015A6D8B9|nr:MULTISPECIES: hypothetical protein [Klebsiella]QQO25965.1 hypothetical protein IMZ21_20015 [Klebsiella michiganensis]WPI51605.1 hypothetical protein R8547_16015 [Klebsiella oxytoca]HDX8776506.1 hypothetical protein [Klebsiella oxytoca]
MTFKLIKNTVNVVWISSIITPLMFSPDWFRRFDLLREEDISNSETTFDGDSVTTDYGWVEINCTPTKAVFQLTKSGLENALADLTASIFSMFQHAETHAVGINTLFDYHFSNEAEWNRLGDLLVPKNHWIKYNQSKILQDDVEYHYGMRSLIIAIENNNKKDDCLYKETINITYAPYRNHNPEILGLNVQYNHDIAVKNIKDAVQLTTILPDTIQRHIADAIKNDMISHEKMFSQVLS